MPSRLMAFAAASGRVAIVFFVDRKLIVWLMSDKASKSVSYACTWVGQQISDLKPDVLVTKNQNRAPQVETKAYAITEAVSQLAEDQQILNPRVVRQHEYANKYEEAIVIAKNYPELERWVPAKRRFFDNEPRNTVLFEAMSYAMFIFDDPAPRLGAALG